MQYYYQIFQAGASDGNYLPITPPINVSLNSNSAIADDLKLQVRPQQCIVHHLHEHSDDAAPAQGLIVICTESLALCVLPRPLCGHAEANCSPDLQKYFIDVQICVCSMGSHTS